MYLNFIKNTICEKPEIERKYYEYKKSNDVSVKTVLATDSDLPFPETYYKSIGSPLRGFNFYFPNLSDSLRNLIQTSPNLINIESEIEETSTVPTQHSFYLGQQQIDENIKNYNNKRNIYYCAKKNINIWFQKLFQ